MNTSRQITETSTVNTFENRFPIAEKRYRILAFLIDFFIYLVISFVMATFLGTVKEDGVSHHMNGLPALTMMIFALILWPISEGMLGQTIGKRLFYLKVVKVTYKAIGFGQAFGRFLLGIIDYIFAIGLIIAIFNKRNRRIADLAADTIVVRINN